MTRYEIEGSPISVAYGTDHVHGVFLSVFDNRLMYDKEASQAVNEVCNNIGVKDGGGSYFDLHTGESGFGQKVNEATMRVYLARYGVPDDKIKKLFAKICTKCAVCKKLTSSVITCSCILQIKEYRCKECQTRDCPEFHKLVSALSNTLDIKDKGLTASTCLSCGKYSTATCAKCHCTYYCSKSCQRADWPVHKFICSSLPFPPKVKPESVYGFYFPETGDKPVLIEIPIEESYDEDDGYYKSIMLSEFLNDKATSHMQRNNVKNKLLNDTLEFCYRDSFLTDGSVTNKIIETITNNQNPLNWRGPVVVYKVKGHDLWERYSYIDVELQDFADVIDFYLWYGSKY